MKFSPFQHIKSISRIIFSACYYGLNFLLKKFVKVFIRSNQDAFYKAANEGDLETVQRLIKKPNVNPASENNYALTFNIRNLYMCDKTARLKIIEELSKNSAVKQAALNEKDRIQHLVAQTTQLIKLDNVIEQLSNLINKLLDIPTKNTNKSSATETTSQKNYISMQGQPPDYCPLKQVLSSIWETNDNKPNNNKSTADKKFTIG